jgi:hypothetical protein
LHHVLASPHDHVLLYTSRRGVAVEANTSISVSVEACTAHTYTHTQHECSPLTARARVSAVLIVRVIAWCGREEGKPVGRHHQQGDLCLSSHGVPEDMTRPLRPLGKEAAVGMNTF